jgi:DNA-binding XRE family transcriptional regulator
LAVLPDNARMDNAPIPNAQSPEVAEGQRLGRRLREARKAAGHTQQSAAVAIGATTSLVQRVEYRGTTKLSTLRALCALYGVPLRELFP